MNKGFLGGSGLRNLLSNAGDRGSIPWKRKWQPPPVFLPGKYHGQRSLAGCTLWGLRESDDLATECKREVAEGLRAVIASVVN